jgi:uncharacterized Zn finger protein
MKKQKQYNVTGFGFECPKCGKEMERRERTKKPKTKNYYFTEWDYCKPCGHVQHYKQYERKVSEWVSHSEDEQTLF